MRLPACLLVFTLWLPLASLGQPAVTTAPATAEEIGYLVRGLEAQEKNNLDMKRGYVWHFDRTVTYKVYEVQVRGLKREATNELVGLSIRVYNPLIKRWQYIGVGVPGTGSAAIGDALDQELDALVAGPAIRTAVAAALAETLMSIYH